MGHSVTSPASNKRMVQVATLKTLLNITSTAYDATLGELADRASAAIRSFCDREFAMQGYTETLSADGGNLLFLRNTPIESVSSVALRGDTATDYLIDDREDGSLFRENGWEWTQGLANSLGDFPNPGSPLNKWTVVYVAGYTMPGDTATSTNAQDLPGDLQEAAIKTIRSWFKMRDGADGVKRKKVGNLEIEYALEQSRNGLPSTVEGLLRRWEYTEGFS